jgi:hypothetical protein
MPTTPWTAVALAAGLGVAVAGQVKQLATEAEFVEVDVSVVDRRNRPVRGLQQSDFAVREDGKPVTISTFREVSVPGDQDPDSARSLVLLLDDTGVTAIGTQAVQTIARAFISSADAVDDVTVVRLHVQDDEPFGDRMTGEWRIGSYRGGAVPFSFPSTAKEVLDRLTQISRLATSDGTKRKTVVCIGSPYICNIPEPVWTTPQVIWSAWTSMLAETARANVVVYALVPGRAPLRGGGLVEFTGGEVFASTYDVGPPIDRIMEATANYYVLGYWPLESTSKPLHKVDVKVTHKGAKARARQRR